MAARHVRSVTIASPNPEEMTMYRRCADPAEQSLANRWRAMNVAIYGTLMLATFAFAHLTSSSVKGEVAQAPAIAMALQHAAAR
jgi:hypothetical protein